MTENVQKDELAEAVREAIRDLRRTVDKTSMAAYAERTVAAVHLIKLFGDYPDLREVMSRSSEDLRKALDNVCSERDAACAEANKLRGDIASGYRLDKPALVGGTAFGEGIAWSMVVECAQRAYDNSRKPLDFDPVAAKKIVDEVRASGKYTIDAANGVGTQIEISRLKRKLAKARERRDFFSTALTAVLRHEGAPPGGVSAFVDAIKGREARIAGLLEKLDKIGVEFASKEAAITALVNAQEETRTALDAGRAPYGGTIAERVTRLVERRDREEARLKGELATSPTEIAQKDEELRRAYMTIGHAVHVLNEAGFVCDQGNMGKAIVDLAHALVVAKTELSMVRK